MEPNDPDSVPLAACWAKTQPDTGRPALTVRDHCLLVGAVAKAIRERLPPALEAVAPDGAETLAAAHDIGKLSPGFQTKCAAWDGPAPTGRIELEGNHAKIGQAWLATLDAMRDPNGRSSAWIFAVGGHHGAYLGEARLGKRSCFEGSEAWPNHLRAQLLKELIACFGTLPSESVDRYSARLHWMTGFITFADWIGSNTEWFSLLEDEPLRDTWSPETATTHASAAVDSLGWHRRHVTNGLTFGDLFTSPSDGKAFTPRPLQSALIDAADRPGLYLVEAPMGMGKTEATLAAAYRRWTEGGERGIYFALPTQLTSNRIHRRITDFLDRVIAEDESLQALVHGNAWLNRERIRPLQPTHVTARREELGDATDAHHWFASGRRALLAPFGTGTIDQALMSVIAAKHSGLRLFALSGKAVILDEVHSYDPYTSALVDRLVTWLLEVDCTVFILSATLTSRRRRELIEAAGGAVPDDLSRDYPLITRVDHHAGTVEMIPVEGDSPSTITIRLEQHSADSLDTLQAIADAAESGACVLVIRNTVRSAQETWRALKGCLRDETGVRIGLIHSRFTFTHREENERNWMEWLGQDGVNRPESGAVLVATQVVEQSVDIDADLLVTDLAPVDLLLQRMGRLHRHPRDARPEGFETPTCWILQPEVDWETGSKEIKEAIGPSAWVYPPFTLFQAERLLRNRSEIRLPDEIRDLLEASDEPPPELPSGAADFLEDLRNARSHMTLSAARQGPFDQTTLEDVEGAKTRWNSQPSAFVVLLAESPEKRRDGTTITLADGAAYTVRPGEFSFPLAKALHEHAVRVPRYLVRDVLAEQPSWLADHIDGAVIAVTSAEDSVLELIGHEFSAFELAYSREEGLTSIKRAPISDLIESEEEFWY